MFQPQMFIIITFVVQNPEGGEEYLEGEGKARGRGCRTRDVEASCRGGAWQGEEEAAALLPLSGGPERDPCDLRLTGRLPNPPLHSTRPWRQGEQADPHPNLPWWP